MTLVIGVLLVVGTVAIFVFSLPRGGKTARFVGHEWEGYVVVAILCVFGFGLMLVVSGGVQLLKGVS
jgi:hypothetical protein